MSVEQGYTLSRFRESRDRQGNLTYLSGLQRLEAIKELNVYNIEYSSIMSIADLFGL